MRHVSLPIVAMLLVPLRQPAAQAPGERVRLTMGSAPSRQLVATFVAKNADSLWVELPGHPVSVAVARVTTARLEVSRGERRETLRGAGIGAGLGAIGGFVISGVAASRSRPCGSATLVDVCLSDWYGRAFRGGVIGGAVGGIIGAALGSAVKTEIWAGVPLSQTHYLSLAPRGNGLVLSLAF